MNCSLFTYRDANIITFKTETFAWENDMKKNERVFYLVLLDY